MSLHDYVAADLAALTSAGSDLGEAATYSPAGGGTPFAITGIVGTPNGSDPRQRPDGVMSDGDSITFRVVAATVEAALLASTGTARLPGMGDTFTVRGHAYAVVSSRPTAGAGCLISADRRRTVGIGPAWGTP